MTAPINTTTLAHNYRPDIDGLRAVAVLSVVIFHAFPDEAWLPGGFIGVDVFFVISGYLISKILFSEIEQHRFLLVRALPQGCVHVAFPVDRHVGPPAYPPSRTRARRFSRPKWHDF